MDPNQSESGESFLNNGPAGETMPPFEPLLGEEAGPAFTVLEPPPVASVEPFSSAEIVEGTAIALVIGLRLENEREAAAFRQAFQWVWKPVLPTEKLLDQLGVGTALANYGIGRGMGLAGKLDQLPPFARIAAGALVLGVAGFMAYRATQGEVTYETNAPVDAASPGPSGDRPGAHVPTDPAHASEDRHVSG